MTRFALAVGEFAKRAKAAPATVVRKVSADLLASIVHRTPVDTGRARASWGVGLNRIDADATATITDKEGATTVVRGQAKLSEWKADDTVWIASRLPYIVALEYGHSKKQAPAGMVRVSIAEVQTFINAAVRSLPR